MPKLRNINPLGRIDVPLIGREYGPAPYYVCDDPAKCGPDHEHKLVKPEGATDGHDGIHGEGSLEPGEVFEVSPDEAKALLEHSESFELVKTEKKG